MPARPQLRALAETVGILSSYQPMAGGPRRLTRDATRELLLAAMGVDASSEAAARRVLAAFEQREAGRLLAPVRVEALGTPHAARLPVRWPAATGGRVDWHVELCEESGRRSTGLSRRRAKTLRANSSSSRRGTSRSQSTQLSGPSWQ